MRRDEVHVWILDLDRRDPGLEATLSADELKRARRFRIARVRRRFVAAHGQLRRVLAHYLDRPPERIRIRVDRHGKPAVSGVSFNLSHSAAVGLVAVGAKPLGVDVERARPRPAAMNLARRHFSSTEIAALERLPSSRRLRGFYACWTRKEAVVKALGLGLRFPLDRFAVSITGRPTLRWLGAPPRRSWELRRVPAPEGYEAAVAVDASVRRVRVLRGK